MLYIGQTERKFDPRLIISRFQKWKILVRFKLEAVFFVKRPDAINERALARIVWPDQKAVGIKLHVLFDDAAEIVELNAEKFHVQLKFVVGRRSNPAQLLR